MWRPQHVYVYTTLSGATMIKAIHRKLVLDIPGYGKGKDTDLSQWSTNKHVTTCSFMLPTDYQVIGTAVSSFQGRLPAS